jgi:threonine dehydratase
VERIVTVSEEAILEAMGMYFTDTHNLAEGASAAGLAALIGERQRMVGKKVGLVHSGGNVAQALFQRVLGRLAG